MSGSFLIIAVDDQEVEDFGDGNKIISGEDERWIEVENSSRIWISSDDWIFSSKSSSSSVSHRLSSSSMLNDGYKENIKIHLFCG